MDPFKRDEKWVIRWRDASGRWHQKRTVCQTKDQARRLLDDLERRAERLQLGLEPALAGSAKMTFAELVQWWWDDYGVRLRSPTARSSLDKHLLPELGGKLLREVTPAAIEEVLVKRETSLKPRSINHLRGRLHRIFSLAIKRGRWAGANPATLVERRRVPKRLPQYLRLDEVPRVLEALAPHWRPLFATAVYTGMRQGELLGLLKCDVDLADGTLAVAHSYDHDTTKGGHADALPIAAELRPYLQQALAASTSALVFPAADGAMQSPEAALDKILRRAMGRAGVVTGYVHTCRRHGCGYQLEAPTTETGRCPQRHPTKPDQLCQMKLWPRAVPRHVRFHDLRHTTATLLLKNGVPLATVQRILRHTDPRLTSEVYGHLDVDDMRKALDGLHLGGHRDGGGEPAPEAIPPAPALLPTGRLLTVQEVARVLGVCRATAYRLVDQRALPHLRISNSVRVSERDLQEYLERQAREQPRT